MFPGPRQGDLVAAGRTEDVEQLAMQGKHPGRYEIFEFVDIQLLLKEMRPAEFGQCVNGLDQWSNPTWWAAITAWPSARPPSLGGTREWVNTVKPSSRKDWTTFSVSRRF